MMSRGSDSELGSFHQFISEQLSVGRVDVSPEEALDQWRTQHPASDADDVMALQEALADMEDGDEGLPIEEFDREFRRRHGLEAR